jgi:hypothetical protein
VQVDGFEGLILYVQEALSARDFSVDFLGLPVLFEDEVIVVVGGPTGRIVLHRNDRGHDDRGIFPAGESAGAVALRFNVTDPDACEAEARQRGVSVLWSTQDASWGPVRRHRRPGWTPGRPGEDGNGADRPLMPVGRR